MGKTKRPIVIGIYKITSPSGGMYIGQSADIYDRWDYYYKYRCEEQTRLYNSLMCYGVEQHTFDIIEHCEESMLNEREIFNIAFFNTFNTRHGLNLREGGANGKPSEETRAKMRYARQFRVGEKAPNFGKPPSLETRKKLSEANLGKFVSNETRAKQSESAKKIIKSEEHCRNISGSKQGHWAGDKNPSFGLRGKDSPNYGKLSPVSKSIIQISLDGEEIKEWDCISDAARHLGGKCSAISAVCVGEKNTAYGFFWKFSNDKRDHTQRLEKAKKNKHCYDKIVQMDMDGNTIKIWNNAVDVFNELKIHKSCVQAMCKGKRNIKSAGGFKWKYYVEENNLILAEQ